MAISTYSELQTAVANYTHRDDTTSRIPEFIQQGEAMLNSRLRTTDMEARATAAMPTTGRYLALPNGFLEMSSLWISYPYGSATPEWVRLEYVTPDVLRELVGDTTETGTPAYFTIKDELEFDVIPDYAYTLEQHYFKKYDIASDSTNWLLTNYPNLYLFSALVYAHLYDMNDQRALTFKNMVDQEISTVNRQESRKRGGHMATLRSEMVTPRSDILRGY